MAKLIEVKNVKHYPNADWEEYLKLDGTSFSGLKNFSGEISYGMKIGKLVHTYLLKPKEYNYEEYKIVRPLASKLIDYVGMDILKECLVEQPITADLEADGFRFKWKGVPDLRMPKIVAIDFKVLGFDLEAAAQRFNYPEQLRGYMMPEETELGLIISVNRNTLKPQALPVIQNTDWWHNIIITRGEVIKQQEFI